MSATELQAIADVYTVSNVAATIRSGRILYTRGTQVCPG